MDCRILLFLCGAVSVPAQTLTLDDAIRVAWTNDPTVAALALTPEIARAREIQAGILPNPELEVRGSAPLKRDSEWSVGAGLNQRLPRRERVELARAFARLGGEAATFELREKRRQLAGEVRRLWYDCAVQDARLAAAQRGWELQRELMQGMERRRTAGEVTDPEWDLLQLEAARAEQAVLIAEAERTGAFERLRHRLRLPESGLPTLATRLSAYLAEPLPEVSGVDDARHPELALATLAVRQAEAAVALAKGESRPDWEVGAGVDFERRSNDATGRLENEPRLSVSASVPWPRHVANRGDILEKEAALKIAEADRDALREKLTTGLNAALAAARAAQPAVLRYQSLLSHAATLPVKLGAAYARGEVSALQLAQARQQQLAIETDYLGAVSRYLNLRAEAETATGLVPDQL